MLGDKRTDHESLPLDEVHLRPPGSREARTDLELKGACGRRDTPEGRTAVTGPTSVSRGRTVACPRVAADRRLRFGGEAPEPRRRQAEVR